MLKAGDVSEFRMSKNKRTRDEQETADEGGQQPFSPLEPQMPLQAHQRSRRGVKLMLLQENDLQTEVM